MRTSPQDLVISVKRLMGLPFQHENVQAMVKDKRRFTYIIQKDEKTDGVRVKLGGELFSPTDLSAAILRKMKEDAERCLGEPVTHAVITVPAYFSIAQKQATRDAGEAAGLRVKKILDEPSAAAMAFGEELGGEDMQTLLVYDLGGGTFDISILYLTGEMFEQVGSEGDMWLGGDDFDQAILNHIIREVKREYDVDLSADAKAMIRLKRETERAKKTLSSANSASVVLESAVAGKDGDRYDVDVEISRRQFEDLPISDDDLEVNWHNTAQLMAWCQDLKLNAKVTGKGVGFTPDTVRNRVKKTILLARKAIMEAELDPADIQHVLMVGGYTAVPLVQGMVEEEFGAHKVRRNLDPMSCVALGAGMAAERILSLICPNCQHSNDLEARQCAGCQAPLVARRQCPSCGFQNEIDAERCANPAGCGHQFKQMSSTHVLAKPVGIVIESDKYSVIIPKGTPFPTPEPVIKGYRTSSETQKKIYIPFYQAEITEFDLQDYRQKLGSSDLDLQGHHVPAGTRVDVAVSVDSNGLFDITASLQDGSGKKVHMRCDPEINEGMTSAVQGGPGDSLGDSLSEASGPPEWEMRLRWSMMTVDLAISRYDWLLGSGVASRLRDLVAQGEGALKNGESAKGRQTEEAIDELLKKEMGGLYMLIQCEMIASDSRRAPGQRNEIIGLVREIASDVRAGASPSRLEPKIIRLVELIKDGPQAEATARDKGTVLV
ncbi:MAG: Hsp70 family protein [Desulfarculus sp.]|nr:Hsp70 family protein [Desulfarculus sp.]